MQAVAVPVHLGSEIGELLPALELGAIVECHNDELRRPFDALLSRRSNRLRNEQRQDEPKLSRDQDQPPDRQDCGRSISDRCLKGAYADTGSVKKWPVWLRCYGAPARSRSAGAAR